jgi:4-hydroxy-tetrahydrodipicolinate synthase
VPTCETLRTVQLVPITAFDRDLQLSLPPIRRHAKRMAEAGIRVFIPCAGSAEFHSLAADEIRLTLEAYRESIGDESSIMAPTGHSVSVALDLLRVAAEATANYGLVMPLNFPYLSDEGARDYFRQLLDESPIPLLIYKKGPVPSNELLLELAEHDNLVGVKYAVNDLDEFRRYAPFFMLAGATGYTSGAGNICPRLTLAMHKAISDHDWDEAMDLQSIILPIEHYRARDGSSFNISMLKYAITHLGLDFGSPRPPQRTLTTEEMEEIDQLLPAIIAAEEQLE